MYLRHSCHEANATIPASNKAAYASSRAKIQRREPAGASASRGGRASSFTDGYRYAPHVSHDSKVIRIKPSAPPGLERKGIAIELLKDHQGFRSKQKQVSIIAAIVGEHVAKFCPHCL